MVAFDGFMSWQKAICFHTEFSILYLHDEWGAQVDQVGITNIWK